MCIDFTHAVTQDVARGLGVMREQGKLGSIQSTVQILAGKTSLEGELTVPFGASGIVLFAHGSGSSRHSPRNQLVARVIVEAGVGTLLFDLLTREEEQQDLKTRELRFDISFLSKRLISATNWLANQKDTRDLRIGYFGSSTGAAAALVAAAELGDQIGAVVSRGGRPDLADATLSRVVSPTLLLVGGLDSGVIELNEDAYAHLNCKKDLKIISGATHLFEEPGTLEEVAGLAAAWFREKLQPSIDVQLRR